MLRLLKNKKGQNTAEYAILIGLVVAVAVGMQTYVRRGINARVKDHADEFMTNMQADTSWSEVGADASAVMSSHFEPEELYSKSTQEVIQDKQTSTTEVGGKVKRTSAEATSDAVNDMQVYSYTYQGGTP